MKIITNPDHNSDNTKQHFTLPAEKFFSPKDFARFFGHTESWGYKRIYDNTVASKVIAGRIYIPACELYRLLDITGPNQKDFLTLS